MATILLLWLNGGPCHPACTPLVEGSSIRLQSSISSHFSAVILDFFKFIQRRLERASPAHLQLTCLHSTGSRESVREGVSLADGWHGLSIKAGAACGDAFHVGLLQRKHTPVLTPAYCRYVWLQRSTHALTHKHTQKNISQNLSNSTQPSINAC